MKFVGRFRTTDKPIQLDRGTADRPRTVYAAAPNVLELTVRDSEPEETKLKNFANRMREFWAKQPTRG